MDWSFLSPVVTGVATAISTAGIVWFYNWIRNHQLKKKIRKAFTQPTGHWSIDGCGLTLHNTLHIPIVIRRIYAHSVANSNHLERKKGETTGGVLLNYHGPSEFGSNHREIESSSDERNYVTLPPYTSGIWAMTKKSLKEYVHIHNCKFAGHSIDIEYLTLFKEPKLLTVEVNAKEDYLAPSLNKAAGI